MLYQPGAGNQKQGTCAIRLTQQQGLTAKGLHRIGCKPFLFTAAGNPSCSCIKRLDKGEGGTRPGSSFLQNGKPTPSRAGLPPSRDILKLLCCTWTNGGGAHRRQLAGPDTSPIDRRAGQHPAGRGKPRLILTGTRLIPLFTGHIDSNNRADNGKGPGASWKVQYESAHTGNRYILREMFR